jgi:glutamate/aspartate transport system substrate-binding protein
MNKTRLLLAAAISSATAIASAQGLTGTLAKVSETGAITIGYREAGIPLSYMDDQQRPIGYAVDLCRKVAEAVQKKLNMNSLDVRFAKVSGSTRIPLIVNGTVDLECGTTTNNLERQKQVAFSVTTFVAANRFATRKADRINSLEDLQGKTVTSNAGSDNLQQANELNESRHLGMTVLPAKDFSEGFLMLETGRASALILDDILLAGVIANSKDPGKYVISSQALSAEPYAIVMRRDDPAFKKVVDDALRDFYVSGGAAQLYKKWFQSPIPPRNITLNLPPSKALQHVWQSPTDSADPAAYVAQ